MDYRALRIWAGTLCMVLPGCSVGPIWAKEIHGRVVDHETKEPVSGVEVFFSYVLGDMWSTGVKGTRWATTNDEGRFLIEGRFMVWFQPFALMASRPPKVELYHPNYGIVPRDFSTETFPDLPSEPIEIWPEIELVTERRARCEISFMCDDLTDGGCERLLEVIRRHEPATLECDADAQVSRPLLSRPS